MIKQHLLLPATVFGTSINLVNTLCKQLKSQNIQRNRKIKIIWRAEYINTLDQNSILRWKYYGAPNDPMPSQEQINMELGELSSRQEIEGIHFLPWTKQDAIDKKQEEGKYRRQIVEHCNRIREPSTAIPVFWTTQKEIKEFLKVKQAEHEREIMQLLVQRKTKPSISCAIFFEWELTRERVKKILKFLDRDRKLQTTFTNVIGATRFKTMEANSLYISLCPKCGKKPDEWSHLKECYNLMAPIKTKELNYEGWLEMVKDYMRQVTTQNPAKYQATEIKYSMVHK